MPDAYGICKETKCNREVYTAAEINDLFEVLEYTHKITLHFIAVGSTGLYEASDSDYIREPLVREGYKPLGIVGIKAGLTPYGCPICNAAIDEAVNGTKNIYFRYSCLGQSKQDIACDLKFKVLWQKLA